MTTDKNAGSLELIAACAAAGVMHDTVEVEDDRGNTSIWHIAGELHEKIFAASRSKVELAQVVLDWDLSRKFSSTSLVQFAGRRGLHILHEGTGKAPAKNKARKPKVQAEAPEAWEEAPVMEKKAKKASFDDGTL